MLALVWLLIVIHLTPQNDSHESGSATLSAAGNATRITISVTGEPTDALQPANVHAGDCAAVAQIRYVLRDVRNGKSTSVIAIPLQTLANGNYAIVLQGSHASLRAAKEYRYVSCGRI